MDHNWFVPELIDTHCHLNLPEHFSDPGKAIQAAREAGVTRLIVIGIDVPSSRLALEIADQHEGVYATVGIHPNSGADCSVDKLDELAEMLKHPKCVALGEVGLDYHWNVVSSHAQHTILGDQIRLARAAGKPVVLHCREAYDDLLNFLAHQHPQRWLLHCFSGNIEQAKRAIDLGCWFGVDGPITYKKAEDLRETVRLLPRDRIVIETDSPYLTRVPLRGKPNQPSYVRFVNEGLASCLGIDSDECARLTTENARKFFGI